MTEQWVICLFIDTFILLSYDYYSSQLTTSFHASTSGLQVLEKKNLYFPQWILKKSKKVKVNI